MASKIGSDPRIRFGLVWFGLEGSPGLVCLFVGLLLSVYSA